VDANSPRWTTVADSPHDHEREALAFLRRRLPDRDPNRVWTNFEFTALSGALYEVDALAITDNGVHLIEIKSHPGRMAGDGSWWQWTTPEGKLRTLDNPRLLANKKAKALKELLAHSKAFARNRAEVPYVREAVFLSDPNLTVSLAPPGRFQVFGRDPEPGEETPAQRRALTGIIDALTSLQPQNGRPPRRLDRPTGARVAQAIEQAGIRERSSRRRVGDYRLVELLADVDADRDTGVTYQDFLVEHVGLKGMFRRLRLYPLVRNATADQREAASRAARREFQLLHRLDHPGIAAPVEFFDHERGPCLLFDYDPDDRRLDRWLADLPTDVDAIDRLDVVRQVAEALVHAHGNGVFHRSLSPSAITISGTSRNVRVRIGDWHAGARVVTGDAAAVIATGTEHVDALSHTDAVLYRAPEHAQPLADPAALDVFSLGALTLTVFTGEPPAPTAGKLRELLASAGHLAADAVGDGVDELLGAFVAELTDADPARRPVDVHGVLLALDGIEEAWTRPEPGDEEPHVLAARRGATLCDGRFEVLGRLGSGSTALALLARDAREDARICVLKIAQGPELNDRIAGEATVLASVDHQNIVKLLDGPLDIDGHATLVLSYAGRRDELDRTDDLAADDGARNARTLAGRIGEAFDAEVTERFGEDLLDAVRYLEDAGLAHRDIKPENLGVTMRGRNNALHLVLFDFSLASVPLDRLDAGTPGYLDPFLGAPGRSRWDAAAERYAAAVVLHELCTGTKPVYGDGKADPGLVDAGLRIDPALFDASVADGLVAFFEKALARDVAHRHGTAADMLWAWREAFRAGRRPATRTDHPTDEGDDVTEFVVPPGTTAASPLAGLPLSARAVAALERLDILTVGDLLGEPLFRLRQARGLGATVRNELFAAIAHLREALSDTGELAGEDAPLTVAARALVARTLATDASAVLRAWLGLDGADRWPSIDDLAAGGSNRELVASTLAAATQRWLKQVNVTAVRDWIADELDAMGGMATADQLADRLARARPALDVGLVTLDGEHERAARAMVRAAIVTEAERSKIRWIRRMLDGAVVVARDEPGGVDGNRLTDYAASLAAATAALTAGMDDPVVSRGVLVRELRGLAVPPGVQPLPDAMLADLAASLCPDVVVNTRLELYRHGMPALGALRASRRAFVAVEQVTVDEMRAKVATRFPGAAPLPDRPELDALVVAAALDLTWNPTKHAYLAPSAPNVVGSSGTLLSSRFTTAGTGGSLTPIEIDIAADFDDRLTRSIDSGGLLVLVTDYRRLERVTDELRRLPLTVVDLDDWLTAELQRITESGKPSWDLIVAADAAGPGSAPWQNLLRVVDRALDTLTERLAATSGTVLVTRCGLLARYDRMNVVARWRDVVHDRSALLAALWMLVASPSTSDVPVVDGAAVPVLTRSEWSRVPREWVQRRPASA
jgi:serine/threonine protein kinase